jgi:hypothetical protein
MITAKKAKDLIVRNELEYISAKIQLAVLNGSSSIEIHTDKIEEENITALKNKGYSVELFKISRNTFVQDIGDRDEDYVYYKISW